MHRVCFEGVELFQRPEQRRESEKILLSWIRTLVRIDMLFLASHPRTPELYKAGVRYIPEDGIHAPKSEIFGGIKYVLAKRGADCEDLAAWRVAELRLRGEQARARLSWRRFGRHYRYHVTVRRGDGRIEDPSARLGMGR